MTEFEIATLAFQEATLAFQKSTLAIQESTLAIQESTLEIQKSALEIQESTLDIRRTGLWIAAAHVAVGLLQAAIVWYGIRAMQRATERRADDARDEARRLAQADERRHTEVMQAFDLQRQALETLIARTAPAGR